MNVLLTPPVDKELDEAINYYNGQLNGLGDQFYKEFENTGCWLRNRRDA